MALGALTELVGRSFEEPWNREMLESAIRDEHGRVWVAGRPHTESAGASSFEGFLLGRRILDDFEIDLLGVDPDCRRQGLGRRLLDEALAAEGRSGVSRALLELRRGNRSARALYEAAGFVVVGERARYYPDGEDALLLHRVF